MKEITIIGNLGQNAVVRQTSDGRSIMTFSVAVNQLNGQPLWFNCISNYREKLYPYLVKGTNVCVIGDLSVDTYNGKIDLSVNCDKTELCGTKKDEAQVSTGMEIEPTTENPL